MDCLFLHLNLSHLILIPAADFSTYNGINIMVTHDPAPATSAKVDLVREETFCAKVTFESADEREVRCQQHLRGRYLQLQREQSDRQMVLADVHVGYFAVGMNIRSFFCFSIAWP